MKQKRVVTIQDISGFGRCSVTVALPIISAAGVETCVLPTAVLSTHTGGFSGFTYRDLTDDMAPIMDHWESLGLEFDAIYTGYLGSFRQLELVSEFFRRFKKEHTTVIVDPAMGDWGKLYKGFDAEFALGMGRLCGLADIIIPNLTEAAFMLGEPFVGDDYDEAYIEGLLRRLAALGPKRVVITGVDLQPGKIGVAAYDAATDETGYYFTERVPQQYHGTGDVYASALVAAIARDRTVHEAVAIAADFTLESVQRTFAAKTDERFGVDFEESLPSLIRRLQCR